MRLPQWILAVLLLCVTMPQARACAVCFGVLDSNLNNAVNMAIFVMFGCLIVVLGSLAAFVIYLARRAARHPLQHDELG